MKRLTRVVIGVALGLPVLGLAAQGFGNQGTNMGWNPLPNAAYDGRFTFFRVRFEPYGGGRRNLWWDHDYPRAERHFMKILQELTTIRPYMDGGNIYAFNDPEMFKYPIAYVSEPGHWTMDASELEGLRAYVKKGGFVIFDDFAGYDWENFEYRWREAFPEWQFVQLDPSHPIFDSFYKIDPAMLASMRHPLQPVQSVFLGAFEDNDPKKRLVAIANYNNDLGDYMEFSDEGWLPIDLSNEAYKLMVNYVVYAMTH